MNPAVTLANCLTGHTSWGRGGLYMAAQLLGAIFGALIEVMALTPCYAIRPALAPYTALATGLDSECRPTNAVKGLLHSYSPVPHSMDGCSREVGLTCTERAPA